MTAKLSLISSNNCFQPVKDFTSAHWKKGAVFAGLAALTALGYAAYNHSLVQDCLYPKPFCTEAIAESIEREWWCSSVMDQLIGCAVIKPGKASSCTPTSTICTETLSLIDEFREALIATAVTGMGIFGGIYLARTPVQAVKPLSANVSNQSEWVVFDPKERIPPAGLDDKIRIDSKRAVLAGSLVRPSENAKVEKMTILKPVFKGEENSHGITEDKRHVLQQQSGKSSLPTAAQMLLLDRGFELKNPLIENVQNIEGVMKLIESHKAKPAFFKCPPQNENRTLEFLRNKLSSYGSGIVSMGAYHSVVLDKIDENNVLFRDPYFGLSISLPTDEFLAMMPCEFIAIRSSDREISIQSQAFHFRERHLHKDPTVISQKLEKEKKAALKQQKEEEGNPSFRTANSLHTLNSSFSKVTINDREIGISHDQGQRKEMEDEDLVVSSEINGRKFELFAIFDGHAGKDTAQFLKGNLQRYIEEELVRLKDWSDLEIWNALKSACIRCDDEAKTRENLKGGSTGVIAFRHAQDLWIANVGDSRAILRKKEGKVLQLSEDAKPYDKKYERSIRKRGGFVFLRRVNNDLAVARSFNDRGLKDVENYTIHVISARPKITKEKIEPGDVLVLCCDGIPDIASSNDIGFVAGLPNKSPEMLAHEITGKAYASGSRDNLSAIVVPF